MNLQTKLLALEQQVEAKIPQHNRLDPGRVLRFYIYGKSKIRENRPTHTDYDEFFCLTCCGDAPGSKDRRDKERWCGLVKSQIDKAKAWRD